MDKIINKILFYTKIILLLIVFTVTLYILFMKMDIYSKNIISLLPMFIPLLLVLIIFIFSLFLNIGKNNLFFNIVCVLVLLSIIIIDYRTLYDSNIISKVRFNFNYFDLLVNKMIFMLYLIFISNILLIIYDKKNKIHS